MYMFMYVKIVALDMISKIMLPSVGVCVHVFRYMCMCIVMSIIMRDLVSCTCISLGDFPSQLYLCNSCQILITAHGMHLLAYDSL